MAKPKLAACGIDCAECDSYKATIDRDWNAAANLVDWYRGVGWIGKNEGAEAVMSKNPQCKGCWDSTDDCFFKITFGCEKRICCMEKQLSNCGECGDFPCGHYSEFPSANAFYQKAMERLLAIKANTKMPF